MNNDVSAQIRSFNPVIKPFITVFFFKTYLYISKKIFKKNHFLAKGKKKLGVCGGIHGDITSKKLKLYGTCLMHEKHIWEYYLVNNRSIFEEDLPIYLESLKIAHM